MFEEAHIDKYKEELYHFWKRGMKAAKQQLTSK